MDRIQRHVERQLGRFDGSGSMPRIVAAWRGAVGDEVARNAWPARVARDGTLHVHTSSSVWAFELGQLAPRILEQLAAELGSTRRRGSGSPRAICRNRSPRPPRDLRVNPRPPRRKPSPRPPR